MTENRKTDFSKSPLYWRKKLDAFLHDPLSKPLDVKGHQERADQQRLAELIETGERFRKDSDFQAAAADRVPFPKSSQFTVPFDAKNYPFRHPLSPEHTYRIDHSLRTGKVDEIAQQTRPVLQEDSPRLDFLARWRFWRLWTQWKEPASAFFPADTRIPDHTLWNHLSITSAFQGCFGEKNEDQPALLLFSLGPVQPLIAAARRIGDLWSGSYLLSYLIADVLAEIARCYGPDHVIFPNLWGQPLVDLHLQDDWRAAKLAHHEIAGTKVPDLWEQMLPENDPRCRSRFLTPSVPNRFLALLPASEVDSFAVSVADRIKTRAREIAESVEGFLHGHPSATSEEFCESYHPERIVTQIQQTFQTHWQTLHLPRTTQEAKDWAREHLPTEKENSPHSSLRSLEAIEAVWKKLPKEHQTNYGTKTASFTWPLSYALLSWALDGVKKTRTFDAWNSDSSWNYGKDQNKDDLTGMEETVLRVANDSEKAQQLGTKLDLSKAAFRKNESLGALTLVKRLWHKTWLMERHPFFQPEDFQMPDTHQLSRGAYKEKEEAAVGEAISEDKAGYMAVLALDGDKMGKWISGENTPELGNILAPEAKEYFREYAPEFLQIRRPLNPSFHLQFSEALGNFSLHTAQRIIEHHAGRLIYAGGDDVLALLPADRSLDCAQSLRRAFRGSLDKDSGCDAKLFDCYHSQPGFLRLKKPESYNEAKDYGFEPYRYDVMMPGSGIDVSVGIAIGHAKSPLQDLVREAQNAEKRAKNQLGRGAVAITVAKRSGEILQWGSKWEAPHSETSAETDPNLKLLKKTIDLLLDRELESRFPQKVISFLEPYISRNLGDAPNEEFKKHYREILIAEFSHCLNQREGGADQNKDSQNRELADLFTQCLESILPRERKNPSRTHLIPSRIDHLCNLFRVAGWMARNNSRNANNAASPS